MGVISFDAEMDKQNKTKLVLIDSRVGEGSWRAIRALHRLQSKPGHLFTLRGY